MVSVRKGSAIGPAVRLLARAPEYYFAVHVVTMSPRASRLNFLQPHVDGKRNQGCNIFLGLEVCQIVRSTESTAVATMPCDLKAELLMSKVVS